MNDALSGRQSGSQDSATRIENFVKRRLLAKCARFDSDGIWLSTDAGPSEEFLETLRTAVRAMVREDPQEGINISQFFKLLTQAKLLGQRLSVHKALQCFLQASLSTWPI